MFSIEIVYSENAQNFETTTTYVKGQNYVEGFDRKKLRGTFPILSKIYLKLKKKKNGKEKNVN